MENLKQFADSLMNRLKKAVASGDLYKANEITANMMVGIMMIFILIFTIICLVLNEVGVFTADKELFRISTVLSVFFLLPGSILNSVFHGEKKWLKYVLSIGLLLQCGTLSSALGHNVTLIMVLPVILTVRYYDEKFSRIIMWICALEFLSACIVSGFFGITDLNMVKFEEGTTISNIVGSLRESIEASEGFDRISYVKSLLLNGFLPRLVIYFIISVSCVLIAKRGRQMIDLQREVSDKAARITTELDLATKIQTSMLPCIFPAFPEHDSLKLFALNIPAKEVGGDFYDYFKIDADHIALVMADVSGKGVGAALFMTISKIVIKNQILSGKTPAEAMTISNQQICETNEAGLFVTAWVGIYEVSTGNLTYVNAGHNPPVIRRKNGECFYLEGKNGFVLAGMDFTKYTESTIELQPGDGIFLYTDGVTEATSTNNELYGEERLLNYLNSEQDSEPEILIRGLKEDIDQFVGDREQFDDITMMVMRVER